LFKGGQKNLFASCFLYTFVLGIFRMILLLIGLAISGDMGVNLGKSAFGIIIYIIEFLLLINAVVATLSRYNA
jgi:hypothetical protein